MPYDRSWTGFGIVGALETGAIAVLVGIVVYALVNLLGRHNGWSHGRVLGIAFAITFLLAGGQDLWDLFYFDLAPPRSLNVLRLKLAAVHDPDAIGLRAFFESIGSLVGVFLGSAIFSGGLRRLMESMRSQ